MSYDNQRPRMYVLFEHAFSRAERQIPYDPKWEKPPGKYEGAVAGPYAPSVQVGRTLASIDERGLKYLFVGTRFGNVLVYEPFPNNDTDAVVYRIQLPSQVQRMQWFHGYQLSEELMLLAVGHDRTPNVGVKLELTLGTADGQ